MGSHTVILLIGIEPCEIGGCEASIDVGLKIKELKEIDIEFE